MSVSKEYKYLLLTTLLVAAFLRLVYVSRLTREVVWVDEFDYLALGKSIAAGQGFVTPRGEPTAFRPPGYPILLAALYKLGIQSTPAVRIVQVFLNVLTIYFLSFLSLKIAGPVASIVTAIVAAGYPYFIYATATLFAFTWFSMTFVLSVFFLFNGLERKKSRYMILAGLFMGISILTRTSAVVLAACVIIWLVIILFKQPKRLLVYVISYGLAVSLVLLPWIIRNAQTMGRVTLSTNAGRNFWLGNNPSSTKNSGSNIDMPRELAEGIDSATETAAESIYWTEALNHIKSDPNRYFVLALQKGAALWRLDPSPTSLGYSRHKKLLSFVSCVSYGPIFILAVLGFFLANREQQKFMLLWILFGFAFTVLHAIFISKVRFRLPLDFFLIAMAASAVAAIAGRWRLTGRFYKFRIFSGFIYDQNGSSTDPCVARRHSSLWL